jgi:general secretion pathway protein K
MSAHPDRADSGQRGMALVLTLLVVVLLVAAVLEFDRSTRTALKAAGNFRDGMKAFHLAASGIAAAQAVLKDDLTRTGNVDNLAELWATPFPPYPVGDGTVAVAIQDEGGKINVNALVKADGDRFASEPVWQVERLKRLFRLKEVDPNLVDAIVDWLDRDDIPEPQGAETAYYQGLDRPYRSRNGHIETLAELHLIKGITDDIYRAITPYLTVYWNGPQGGESRINVNTADPLVLESLAVREGAEVKFLLDAAQVEQLVAARPFKTILNEVDKVPGLSKDVVSKLNPQLDVKSQFFSIYAEGEANGVKKGVIAVADRVIGDPVLTYWRLAD